ncbi:hypothetical protein ACFQMB_00335 [Pseudobowmanella zhangzhouensis]|uniref:MatE protein n=1 Tax=Pseudobowmanella zhangzhouensis TaxID=1537679 RepID=A0ABW1XF19_9ALTE
MNQQAHRKIAAIVFPMLLANISQPLLGLVDTYVVGHMPQVSAMAGVALGAMLITQLYWLVSTLPPAIVHKRWAAINQTGRGNYCGN